MCEHTLTFSARLSTIAAVVQNLTLDYSIDTCSTTLCQAFHASVQQSKAVKTQLCCENAVVLNIPITQYHTNVEAPELRTPRYNVGSHAMVAVIKNGCKVDVVREGSTFIKHTRLHHRVLYH